MKIEISIDFYSKMFLNTVLRMNFSNYQTIYVLEVLNVHMNEIYKKLTTIQ